MIIDKIFETALPVDQFIEEYYKIMIMQNEEFNEYNKTHKITLGNFDTEIKYLKRLKNKIDFDTTLLNEDQKIKLKNIIKRIEIRQERFRDINEKIFSLGLLYDYSSFFGFLDSIVTFHNQSILFTEEKELDEEIIRNRVKFRALAEKNFSTVVEKIQTSYFNKEFSTFAEVDMKLKNLKKIQEKFNITTLLEFTQLIKQIENDQEIIKNFFKSHEDWRQKETAKLLELYKKKLPIEIRVKNSREKYNSLIKHKEEIKEFIEEKLINQINAVTINIDSLAYYEQTILKVKEFNQELASEKLNSAIKDAEIASEAKKEIIHYLKNIRNNSEFSIEKKISIVNDNRNFRNIDKFPKLKESIKLIKENLREELYSSFGTLIKEKRFDILESFTEKNLNFNLDEEILAYESLSSESESKIKYLKKLKDLVNPIKAKMRVIAMQPSGLPKLRAIEKFQSEILKNKNIEKDIKAKILEYFVENYKTLVKTLKISSDNYNLTVYDVLKHKYYRIFIREDKLIKIGRKGEPLNDLILYCKHIKKEHLAIDLNKRNIINYFEQDENNNKIYNNTVLNDVKLEEIKKLAGAYDRVGIAGLLEGELRTVSDDTVALNFTRIYDESHCSICDEKVLNCKGCREEHLDHLNNSIYIFARNNKLVIYLDDENNNIVKHENYDNTSLKVEIDHGTIFTQYPFLNLEKNLITETEFLLHDRFLFNIQLINAKVF